MESNSVSNSKGKKKHSRILLIFTTIYAVLYAILLLSFLIFEYSYTEITFEGIVVSLAVIIFFFGYYYSWKNEMIAGIIFIIWYGIMCYIGLILAESDRGVAAVMGFPMFIIGILLVIYWFRTRSRTNVD